MGSRMRGLGGLHRGFEGFARGELERHFGRIDVVIRAVVNGTLEIDHRKAREKAVGGRFHDSLFHRGNEIARNGAAENFIGEFELAAAREGLQANPAIAELAVAAGLFLVPALDFGPATNGFAIRNLRRVQLHVDAVALLQTADDDFDVLLAAAREQKFLGLRIAIEAQRLIFFEDALDGVAEAIFILAALGGNREGDGGLRQMHRVISNDGRLVAQGVAGDGLFELCDGADVAGFEIGDRLDGLAFETADVRQAFGGAAAGVDEIGVVLDDARDHLEVSDAAGERVGDGFEDEG